MTAEQNRTHQKHEPSELTDELHGETEPGTDEAWDSEIKRRVEELDSRAVKTIPWSEAREKLFGGFM